LGRPPFFAKAQRKSRSTYRDTLSVTHTLKKMRGRGVAVNSKSTTLEPKPRGKKRQRKNRKAGVGCCMQLNDKKAVAYNIPRVVKS